MSTSCFSASTQYNDLRGTVAADRADTSSVETWLEQQGLLQEGERLVGISFYASQLPENGKSLFQVSFLLAPIETDFALRIPGIAEPQIIFGRRIERQMELDAFFRFFKRLELTLSSDGELEGRNFTNIG